MALEERPEADGKDPQVRPEEKLVRALAEKRKHKGNEKVEQGRSI
jgi:hypothetical protein